MVIGLPNIKLERQHACHYRHALRAPAASFDVKRELLRC